MESVFITTRKQRIIREMRDYMMIALGMLMYSIGWTVFLLPNDITTGGVPGIASIVYWATGVNVQYTYFAINGALLVASLIILGWKFSVKTVIILEIITVNRLRCAIGGELLSFISIWPEEREMRSLRLFLCH